MLKNALGISIVGGVLAIVAYELLKSAGASLTAGAQSFNDALGRLAGGSPNDTANQPAKTGMTDAQVKALGASGNYQLNHDGTVYDLESGNTYGRDGQILTPQDFPYDPSTGSGPYAD